MDKQSKIVQSNDRSYHLNHVSQSLNRFIPEQVEETQNLSGHWSQKQRAKYFAFVDKFRDRFSQKESRRQWKIFKALSEFIKTRTANQCRSHHHKMSKNFKTVEETLEFIRKRNPFLEVKAKKYSEELSKMQFKGIEQSEFSKMFRRIRRPIRKQFQTCIKNNQQTYKTQQYYTAKSYDLSNIPTDLNYLDQCQSHIFQQKYYNRLSFPTTNMLHRQLQNNNINYMNTYSPYSRQAFLNLREKRLIQCHESFIKWINKINSLMN